MVKSYFWSNDQEGRYAAARDRARPTRIALGGRMKSTAKTIGGWSGATLAALATVAALPAVAAGPKDTLRIAMYANSPALGDVFVNAGSPSQYFFGGIFDTITLVNEKGELAPYLATSWEIVNPTTWRFKIRPNVVFSNGEKLDAQAIVSTFDYMLKSDEGKAKGVSLNLSRLGLESVTAIDNLTIEAKTKAPYPLLGKEFFTVRVVAPKAWKDMGTKDYAKKPATSGPWQVANWSDNQLDLTRFDKSWRPAKIDKIAYRIIPEEVTRVQALVSDQTDLVMGISPDNIAVLEKGGHAALVKRAPLELSWVLLSEDNLGKKKRKMPFADKRVRLAANMAIDRDAIVKNLLLGLGGPSTQPANEFTFGYNKNVSNYPYDPAKAKELLANAGYPNGFDLLVEVYVGGIAKDSEMYQYAADALSRIGIRTTLKQLAFNDYFTKNVVTGDIEGDAFGLSLRFEPLMDPITVVKARSCLAPGHKYSCEQAHVDKIRAVESEMDVEKRRKMMEELMQIIHDDAVSLHLTAVPEIYGHQKRVKNLEVWNQRVQFDRIELVD
ncbi:MAG: hypothetical protein EXQ85_05005 [Alphaproteobacteria bacterium]|nr:hypothetical protein [Alphaproteobacteria bacterium]